MAQPKKLTAEQTTELRQAVRDGIPLDTLATKYNVIKGTLKDYITGVRFPELPGAIPSRKWSPRGNRTLEQHRADILAKKRETSRRWQKEHANDPDHRRRAREYARADRMKKGVGGWPVPPDSVCAICGCADEDVPFRSNIGVPTTRRKIVMDHDHGTGDVRGPLCMTCNTFVGRLEADPERTKKALTYLAHWTEQGTAS